MKTAAASLAALLLALVTVPATAGPSGFSIVNATGLNMNGLTIRRFGSAPSPGARSSLQFSDADCLFDIQASLHGVGTVLWSGVNLCEVKVVGQFEITHAKLQEAMPYSEHA